jgi:hypothetical protein
MIRQYFAQRCRGGDNPLRVGTISGRSDLALVRSLRTGRQRRIAVHILQAHEDAGLYRTLPAYPDLPNRQCAS